jgi:hypothetical protein
MRKFLLAILFISATTPLFAHAGYYESERRAEEYNSAGQVRAREIQAATARAPKENREFIRTVRIFARHHKGLASGLTPEYSSNVPQAMNAIIFSTRDNLDCKAEMGGLMFSCVNSRTLQQYLFEFTPGYLR